jgi:hypothetical protein
MRKGRLYIGILLVVGTLVHSCGVLTRQQSEPEPFTITIESGSTRMLELRPPVPAHHFDVLFELDGVVVKTISTLDTMATHRFDYPHPGLHALRCGLRWYNEGGDCPIDSLGNCLEVWSDTTWVFIKFLGKVDAWWWYRLEPNPKGEE